METTQPPKQAELRAPDNADSNTTNLLHTIRLRYPSPDTLPAIPLAIMLLGREVSTPSMTYSQLHATRLPAYIGQLRECGLGNAIVARNLPLTPKQKQRRYSKPFAAYHLTKPVIEQLGINALQWAQSVIALHGITFSDFPMAPSKQVLTGGLQG